jgi:hypothetical protein
MTSGDALDLNVTNIKPQNIVFGEKRHCTEYRFVEVLATAVTSDYSTASLDGAAGGNPSLALILIMFE